MRNAFYKTEQEKLTFFYNQKNLHFKFNLNFFSIFVKHYEYTITVLILKKKIIILKNHYISIEVRSIVTCNMNLIII